MGFAQYLPKEIFLRTRDQILDMVCMALAGRAAEQVPYLAPICPYRASICPYLAPIWPAAPPSRCPI